MKPNIAFVVVLCVLLLGGCRANPPVPESGTDAVLDELSKTAAQVRDEMRKMNIQNGTEFTPIVDTVNGCSSKLVSIDFDGDVMLFIEDLRKSKFCKVRVNGKKPKQDLVLSLHHKKVPLWHVLEDAGVQLGNLALITVTKESVVVTFGEVKN
jgi:hypothetical protein